MHALHSFENTVTPKPLFFPKVDPRHLLVDSFSEKIKAVCDEKGEVGSMIFLLFQREVMLRRTPDPTLIRWANTLEFEGDQNGRDTLYVTYLVRKWLACLPPVFSQLSCLSTIHILGENDESEMEGPLDPEERRSESEVSRSLTLNISEFLHPEGLLKSIMASFLQTIPFLGKEGQSLREATWMHEGAVFSMQEWWIRFVGCFPKEEGVAAGDMPEAAKLYITQYLKDLIYTDTSIKQYQPLDCKKRLISMLAQAEIHSFTG